MVFNLNEFLMATSFALDFVEMDIFGVATNHSKRVAYISMRIAENMGMTNAEIFDLVALSILHDNGATAKLLNDSLMDIKIDLFSLESKIDHCIKGEENIMDYPFLTDIHNIIKYHHEHIDGSGFFGLKGEEIPKMAQIIRLADAIELNFEINEIFVEGKEMIWSFVKANEKTMFDSKLVNAFLEVSEYPFFWLELKDNAINQSIYQYLPIFNREFSLEKIQGISQVFSKIIDSKSTFTLTHSRGLSEKIAIMGDFYQKPQDEIFKLKIAADLHDLGKLVISNTILDKPGKLDVIEFDMIRRHSFYTRLCLQEIKGFEDITEWASNHHEKLNGTGYPYGKTGKDLDFNSRLLACVDIYQALMEERPYRASMRHEQASDILKSLVEDGALDEKIVADIIKVFPM